VAQGPVEPLEKFENDPHTRKFFNLWRLTQLGIDDNGGKRQGGSGLVVVGDQDIQTVLEGVVDLFMGLDPAVHGHHKGGVFLYCPLDALEGDAIALFKTVWNIGDDPCCAQFLEVTIEQGQGGDPVYIVIPVDEDGFPALNGLGQPLDGYFQSRDLEGVGQVFIGGMEKGMGVVGRDAPAGKDLTD